MDAAIVAATPALQESENVHVRMNEVTNLPARMDMASSGVLQRLLRGRQWIVETTWYNGGCREKQGTLINENVTLYWSVCQMSDCTL